MDVTYPRIETDTSSVVKEDHPGIAKRAMFFKASSTSN